MWLKNDLAWWGFVVAVISIVLMLPVAIAANLLTSSIQNLWAERSERSRRQRIAKLEKELSDLETQFPATLSEADDYGLMGIEALLVLCVGAIQTFLVFGMIFFEDQIIQLGISGVAVFALALIVMLSCFFSLTVVKAIRGFRRLKSPTYRDNLRGTIRKLQSGVHVELSKQDAAR